MTGTIAQIRRDMGFGFIEGADGLAYFFHRTALERASPHFQELVAGDRVEFTPTTAARGPRAEHVVVEAAS